MDKAYSQAVEEAFNRLYKKGLIYQGERIINWCPKCRTAISDLENVHEEMKGKLYFIEYGPITLATTRPETMFADVAVAIHPKNKKYRHLLGKKVPLPLTHRKIPVIADKAVDPKFGTGALKITPAHDSLDFEIGERHKLEKLVAIGHDGKLTKMTGKYAGLPALEARKGVVQDLKKGNYLKKIQDYEYAIGHCQRCGTMTEPLISKQWFVKTKPLAEKAIKAVKRGQIKIVPKRFEKVYFQWMENIRDWCISRQLWWGHKIPIKNEEDILDTWFSSGLWPISVFGWPEKTRNLDYFYPTTVRETAYDILFFWVAKEIMMCLEMTGKIPFEVVYLHGLVRDEKGRKFSKTKGIGFDPLEIIEKYGADALRMTLVVGNPPGNDLKADKNKPIAYRNFANKIWNIGRFVMNKLEQGGYRKYDDLPSYSKSLKNLSREDKKITKDLEQLIKDVTAHIEQYRFDLAADKIYHFIWHRFADEYVESSKKRIEDGDKIPLIILRYVYFNCLKLLHPFMPFITEEVWQRFPRKFDQPLIISLWPKVK
jgi:valyl-tRNA synthetase